MSGLWQFGDVTRKPYYNHDETWTRRKDSNAAVWGTYSVVLYERVLGWLQTFGGGSLGILDVGCGAGKLGTLTLAAGHGYLGVDESGVAIALGKEHWPEVSLRRCDFALDLSEDVRREFHGVFDAVVSLNALHCLEGSHRFTFLQNMRDCTREGGLLVLTTMIGPPGEGFRASRDPRVYKSAEEVLEETRACGWGKPLMQEILPASPQNPIANIELVVRVP